MRLMTSELNGLGLVAALLPSFAEGSSSCASHAMKPLADNFRDLQPLNPYTRTVYRSAGASSACSAAACDATAAENPSSTCLGNGMSDTERVIDTTRDRHWSYSDQDHCRYFMMLFLKLILSSY